MKQTDFIQNVQHRATKQIPGISHQPYTERSIKLDLLRCHSGMQAETW